MSDLRVRRSSWHTRRIVEHVSPGRRLGRHVVHDPRSRGYAVEPRRGADGISVGWRRYIPMLDQGSLGSCVGNAAVGVLGSSRFYGSLAKARAGGIDLAPGLRLDESTAVHVYGAATALDPWPGEYPPTDTGTSGLAAARVLLAAGLIKSYRWAFGMDALHTAILAGPLMVGVNWYESMDEPNEYGEVTVAGQIRGGHEFELIGYSDRTFRWRAVNSWGAGWGKSGYFYLHDAALARLMDEDGDATLLEPLG